MSEDIFVLLVCSVQRPGMLPNIVQQKSSSKCQELLKKPENMLMHWVMHLKSVLTDVGRIICATAWQGRLQDKGHI